MNHAKTYQAYYTKSAPIVDYMVKCLNLQPTDRVLEPCAGDGVFVDEIANLYPQVEIDAFELNHASFELLKSKYEYKPNIYVRQTDTLLDEDLAFKAKFGGIYEKIIANPPYGAWQDYDKRDLLKKIYPDLYVKETYGLFLYRCIDLLKEEGKLVFIIPDTFLNLHSHRELRKFILTNTKIESISLFPSAFFPNVSFGYANLCIISLEKCSRKQSCLNNSIAIRSGFSTVNELSATEIRPVFLTQNEVFNNSGHAFILSNRNAISSFKNIGQTIGDVADCVTGFYSGNDKDFLQTSSTTHRNAKNYETIKAENICRDFVKNPDILDGVAGNPAHFIPMVKGGGTRFCKPDDWFINWSKAAVNHYKTDKKARFQNPKYYFREGVAVPMVSSSSITAALLENRIFDQSIVGIFPKEERLVWYLLAFFNSPTANQLIRSINPSANNSANYIKKIPFFMPNPVQLATIDNLTKTIYQACKNQEKPDPEKHNELNQLIAQIYEAPYQD